MEHRGPLPPGLIFEEKKTSTCLTDVRVAESILARNESSTPSKAALSGSPTMMIKTTHNILAWFSWQPLNLSKNGDHSLLSMATSPPFDALIACAQTTETVFPSEPRLNVSLRSGYGPLLQLEAAADAQCPHDNATTYPKDATRHSNNPMGSVLGRPDAIVRIFTGKLMMC